MKRYLLSLALLCLVATGAHAYWQSRSQVAIVTGGGGYTGPGDVATGALAFHGLRGYTAAYAAPGTNCAIDIEDQAGANLLTCIVILSNGNLDVATVATWVAAHSVTTIKVPKIYDQTGNARHLPQGTLANMPILTLNALGSLPAIQVSAAPLLIGFINGFTQAQPLTMSAVAERTSGTSLGGIYGNTTVDPTLVFAGSANNVAMFAGGTSANVAALDNAPHAIQGVFNGASSTLSVDGSAPSTVNPGTDGFSNNGLQVNNSSFPYTGFFFEGGIWSGTSVPALSSNQRAYWGF